MWWLNSMMDVLRCMDALMPVMERLGLVVSVDATEKTTSTTTPISKVMFHNNDSLCLLMAIPLTPFNGMQSSGAGLAQPDFVVTAEGLSMAFAECKRHGVLGDVAWKDIKGYCGAGFPRLFYQAMPYLPLFIATGNMMQFGILWQNGKVWKGGMGGN